MYFNALSERIADVEPIKSRIHRDFRQTRHSHDAAADDNDEFRTVGRSSCTDWEDVARRRTFKIGFSGKGRLRLRNADGKVMYSTLSCSNCRR